MLRRSIQHLIAYVVACLVFGATLVLFVIPPGELASTRTEPGLGQLSVASMLALASAIQTAIFAAAPALLAVAFAEWRRIRDWAFYAVTAILIAVAGFLAQYMSELQGQPTIVNNYALIAFVTAGFCAGLTYWALAGRATGLAQRSDRPPAKDETPRPPERQPGVKAATPPIQSASTGDGSARETRSSPTPTARAGLAIPLAEPKKS